MRVEYRRPARVGHDGWSFCICESCCRQCDAVGTVAFLWVLRHTPLGVYLRVFRQLIPVFLAVSQTPPYAAWPRIRASASPWLSLVLISPTPERWPGWVDLWVAVIVYSQMVTHPDGWPSERPISSVSHCSFQTSKKPLSFCCILLYSWNCWSTFLLIKNVKEI